MVLHPMRRLWLLFSQAVTVVLATVFVIGTLKPHWLGPAPRAAGWNGPPVVTLRSVPTGLPRLMPEPAASGGGYATAARVAAPAVVSVMASKSANAQDERGGSRPFNALPRVDPDETGFGSGVIVSSDGVLLTNNHVVEGAGRIMVRLSDGRQAVAEVVGTDPETDLAVLRIALDELPAITLGRVDALQVGDAVLAIGNPFNVGQTVTAGIVSALGRQGLGLSTFESFIQTDAAINPGNSGGALVDAQGHLVGINTAIFSRSGGSMGIGFAIPVDLARQVMESLLRDGQVTRGWLGVEPRELTPEFVESFHLPVSDGVLITGVLAEGPAAKGGMRPGDVVREIDGRTVHSVPELLNQVAALTPGQPVTVAVQRGSQALELKLSVARRPPQIARR